MSVFTKLMFPIMLFLLVLTLYSSPLSSSVFAYNALFTKPAQSCAPMLGVAVLNRNFYQEKLTGDITSLQHQELSSAMFTLACAIPFVIGLLQIIVWRPYSIRDSHITIAKHVET